MNFGLDDSTLEKIINILSKNEKINKAVIFGSRAKGNYKNGSDIDIALFGKYLDIQDIYNIHLLIEELFLPYTFDIVIFDNIKNEELKEHIKIVGKTIYKKNPRE
jgi:predicted nucleotidyltransferase